MIFYQLSLPWTILAYISAFAFILFLYYNWNKHIDNNKKEWEQPKIKDGVQTAWGWCVRHPEKLTIGENTDIGFGTYIQAKNGVYIGKNVKIGAHCAIYSENTIDGTESTIHIESNVKIGAGTVILPNPTGAPLFICHDSVIGALSLVKQHIPSNSIYVGVPAKQISNGKPLVTKYTLESQLNEQ